MGPKRPLPNRNRTCKRSLTRHTLATCLEAARNFQFSQKAAKDIIDRQIGTIRDAWDKICEEAALTEVERNLFGQRIFLNDYIFEGAAEGLW